jgi:CRP-like cAMP-binding protein
MKRATLRPLDDVAMPADGVAGAHINALCARIPTTLRSEVRRFCDRIDLEPGRRLFGAEEPRQYLYLPHSGAIGLIACLPSGQALQIALVDRHGIAGLPPLGRNPSMPCDALVQLPGAATRMRIEALNRLRPDPTFGAGLYAYLYSLSAEAMQSALCTSFHAVEQRCARWLLMLSDIGGNEFFLTQDHLSTMLGVRRPSVTMGALALQQRGAISYRYGRMVIRDRSALEQSACTCYRTIRDLRSDPL